MEPKGHVEIFEGKGREAHVEVRFEEETVWLSQKQIADLFQRERSVISKHINNIFSENELDEKSNVQKMHITNSDKPTNFYNLEVIISVGYRVKSKRGVEFRQWATQRLKDHLIQGYTLNEKRLQQISGSLEQLEKTIRLIETSAVDEINVTEAKGLLDIISKYTKSFILLNRFDSHSLEATRLSTTLTYEIEYADAKPAIELLKQNLIDRKEASELFGNEKDESFQGILKSVVQTFDKEYLYPSIEEQAAHLLYFVIKSHPFSDGNKRIGAFLFIWFLEKNRHRFKSSGELKINDNALAALALLVAQSNPDDKELMVNLIINLINGG